MRSHTRRKGNEGQEKFNCKVQEILQEAKVEMNEIPKMPALDRTKAALEKGIKHIAESQKMIKLVDQSDNGWEVMPEYTADELAENSDDEKRTEKAKKAAERKVTKKRVAQPVRQHSNHNPTLTLFLQ